jgi:phosphoglycolate phosphatase
LLNTLADLADSMNAALIQMGFPTHPTDAYRYFVGDSVDEEARRALPPANRDLQTIKKCVEISINEYTNRWDKNTKPYPGIPQLLDELERLKIAKTIFSNKPDNFTKLIAEKLLADWSFDFVIGVSPTAPKKPDPSAAIKIAESLKILPHQFLYLGDTNTDMQTAVAAGMYPVGALWGFRSADELLANGAKTLVKKPLEVLGLLKC